MGLPILNDDLRESLENVLSIRTMIEKELKHVEGNKHHLDKLVPENLKGDFTKSMRDALLFKERVLQDSYKSGVILLTATFERVALAKYKTASGEMMSFLEKNKDLSIEYFVVKDRFVNPALNWLSELLTLLENRIDGSLFDKLAEIKEQRNSYAHGNLDTIVPVSDNTLEDIALTFDKVLKAIEQRGPTPG